MKENKLASSESQAITGMGTLESGDESISRTKSTNKIPICINDIDLVEQKLAFEIAHPHESTILTLFHSYEDGKELMRVE